MKKMTCLLLAALLLLLSVSALADDVTPAQVVGTWYLQNRDESVMLTEYRMELNRDKSAVLVMNGVEKGFSWSISGDSVVLSDDEDANAYYFTFENGELNATAKDFSVEETQYFHFVFGREEVKVELPEAKTLENEEDFYGDYAPLYTVKGDSLNKEDQEILVNVDFAQITISNGEYQIITMTDFKDGKLLASEPKADRNYPNIVIEATEADGVLKATFSNDDGEEGYAIYFQAVEAAAAVEEAVEAPATEE